MRLSKIKLAIIALIIANIIWGASYPIYKWSLESVPPYTFSFLRLFLAGLLILPFTLHKLTIQKEDIPKLLMLSFFGITVPITAIFLGLETTESINGPIIASSAPIFLILFAVFFLREHPKRKVIYGTLLSLVGIVIIVFRPLVEKGLDDSIIGNFFFILTVLGSVYHTLMLKSMMHKYRVLTLTFWYFILGSLPLIPLMLNEMQTAPLMQTLDARGLIGIAFGVVLSSFVAHVIFNYGVKQIHASEVGVFTYIDPVAAAVIAIPLLGESITSLFLVGSFFVFAGIFFAEGRLHWHPFHKLR